MSMLLVKRSCCVLTLILALVPTPMSLADLQPINTKKTKSGAVNVFMRFLREEEVTLDAVDFAVRGDPTGATLVALMDRFGVHLAFCMGKGGHPLARHTVMEVPFAIHNGK